jgi:DNA-binding LacI/PurR family transcriptional regulator
MSSRPTLNDVARLAGVSITSASMALADSPRVAAVTKIKVRKAAEDLDYVPHSAGRALRQQRVGAIAIVVPHSTGHVFAHPALLDLLQGITSVANEHDLVTILSTSESEEDEASAYMRIMRGRRADGVIIAAAASTDHRAVELAGAGYPTVVVGRAPQMPSLATVGVDDLGGGAMITRHLIESHGAARIAHVSGPLRHQSALDKRQGYVAALAEAGLSLSPRLQFEGDYSEESGMAAAQHLLPHVHELDGVFFGNDQMAFGAYQAFREAGVDVPGDLAVVGYDNHPMTRYTQPSLTTVAADMVGVGSLAAQRLLDLLETGNDRPVNTILPTELVVRDSCGCGNTGHPVSLATTTSTGGTA